MFENIPDMREKNIRIKALEVVEALGVVYSESAMDLKTADKIIESMYKCSHIALGNCSTKHDGWDEEFDRLYESLRGKYIKDE